VIRALANTDLSDFYDWHLENGKVMVLENFEPSAIDLELLRASLPPR
jgi:hypothetical protein